MKRLIHINEYLIKKKVDKVRTNYIYVPKTREELRNNIEELLDKGETDLNCIDTSNITDMSYLFLKCYKKYKNVNFDVSGWDVSKVKNMRNMFCECEKFDCDLSNWNVSSVENMNCMFMYCSNFTGKGLEKWDISNVKDIYGMFLQCEKFDCDLSSWNVSNVENMQQMFSHCFVFTGKGLENWDVSNVENMNAMFYNCENLNCDLSNWNIRKVKDMSLMFRGCKNFDCNLEKWNISKVSYGSYGYVNTYDMFDGCTSLKNTPSWYKYKK